MLEKTKNISWVSYGLIPYVLNVVVTMCLFVIVGTDGNENENEAKNMGDYSRYFSNIMKTINLQMEEHQQSLSRKKEKSDFYE